MYLFLKKISLYLFVLWLLNIAIGQFLLSYEQKDLVEIGQFYPKPRWEDYYQQQTNIDILVLGSSHAFRSFDPNEISVGLAERPHVFIFGSSGQTPITSYYVLKEVLQKHRPKQVILDLYFMVFTSGDLLKSGRYNWQEMQTGPGKSDFFWNGFSFREKLYLRFFPAYVHKDYLKFKLNKLVKGSVIGRDKGSYKGNGFVSKADTLNIDKIKNNNQFDVFTIEPQAITQRNLLYLEKIKFLCAQEHIELIFVSTPMPAITVEKISIYTDFYNIFNQLAEEWAIPFYDYNIDRLPELSDSTHYFDDDHVNAAGAKVFSKAFTKAHLIPN